MLSVRYSGCIFTTKSARKSGGEYRALEAWVVLSSFKRCTPSRVETARPLKAGETHAPGREKVKPVEVAITSDSGSRNTRGCIYSGSHFRPNAEGTS